jgi:hypothetical protein
MAPEVPHWRLHQGSCLACGTLCRAALPGEHASGYGPRLTGFSGVNQLASLGQSQCGARRLCLGVWHPAEQGGDPEDGGSRLRSDSASRSPVPGLYCMPTSLTVGMVLAEQRSSIPVPESQRLDEHLGKSTIGRLREDYLVQATE